jgi:hypothetical protein
LYCLAWMRRNYAEETKSLRAQPQVLDRAEPFVCYCECG